MTEAGVNCGENLALLACCKADGGLSRLPLSCVMKTLKYKLKIHIFFLIVTRIYFASIILFYFIIVLCQEQVI